MPLVNKNAELLIAFMWFPLLWILDVYNKITSLSDGQSPLKEHDEGNYYLNQLLQTQDNFIEVQANIQTMMY